MIAHRPRRKASPRHTALGFALMGVLALCAAEASVHAQCEYEVTAIIEGPRCLPPFEESPLTPTAINDNGVVTGFFQPCLLGDPRPFIWSEELGFIALPLPPGVTDASPTDINNNDEIVGSMNDYSSDARAFRWKDGVWTDLGVLPGGNDSTAFGINDVGEIVGESTNIFVGPLSAFFWHNGNMEELKLPIGPFSHASDINDQSTIVGWMGTASRVGFIHSGGITTAIPPLSNQANFAVAINEHGVVAGWSWFDNGQLRRSWIYENGKLIELGMLRTVSQQTMTKNINDAGQVVGYAANTSQQAAWLWQHGEIYDLNILIKPFDETLGIGLASGINNHGVIIAHEDGLGYVLTPINRPLGDVNIDCAVDAIDIADVLRDWGPCPERGPCLCDIVDSATFQPPGDGVVDGADLAVVLGSWTVR